MDNVKNNVYYLKRVVGDIKFILSHTEGITEEALEENEVLLDSVMFRLIQISENTGKLTADFKVRYNAVPWQAIKGMRNRIVHEYGDVETSIIYDTIKDDLPALLSELKGLI